MCVCVPVSVYVCVANVVARFSRYSFECVGKVSERTRTYAYNAFSLLTSGAFDVNNKENGLMRFFCVYTIFYLCR